MRNQIRQGALATLLLHTIACGQIGVPQQGAEVARLNVQNPSRFARTAVVTAAVPFAPGKYRGSPLELSTGQPVQVLPHMANWPDGSWRAAQVTFPVALAPNQTTPASLVPGGSGKRPGFFLDPAVAAGMPLLAAIRLDGNLAMFGGSTWKVLEAGKLRWRFRSRIQVPNTPIQAELVIDILSGHDACPFWLQVLDSDLSNPSLTHPLGKIEFLTANTWPEFHYGLAKTVQYDRRAGGAVVQLTRASVWGTGEGQAWRGELVFRDTSSGNASAAPWPVLACADWTDSGAFGPWGQTGQLPAGWDATMSANLATSELSRLVPGDPWQVGPMGLNKVPADTGRQYDFGVAKLTPCAQGWPDLLEPAGFSVLQEACRPTHLRDQQGEPVRFEQHLPGLHMWKSQVFWTGQDFLGLSVTPANAFENPHGWAGRDREHWSANVLHAYWCLTADYLAGQEVEHHASLWLANLPGQVKTGHPIIDGAGPARDIGRTLKAGAWAYLATGRQDVQQRLRERIDVVADRWPGGSVLGLGQSPQGPVAAQPHAEPEPDPHGHQPGHQPGHHDVRDRAIHILHHDQDVAIEQAREIPPPAAASQVAGPVVDFTATVLPLAVQGPDPRKLSGLYVFDMPWQGLPGVTGLDAVYQVTGYQPARELAYLAGGSLVHHGIWNENGGPLGVGDAVAWKGGRPLTAAEIAQGQRQFATDNGAPSPRFWNQWGWAGVKVMEELSRERGDTATLTRVNAFLSQESRPGGGTVGQQLEALEWRAIR